LTDQILHPLFLNQFRFVQAGIKISAIFGLSLFQIFISGDNCVQPVRSTLDYALPYVWGMTGVSWYINWDVSLQLAIHNCDCDVQVLQSMVVLCNSGFNLPVNGWMKILSFGSHNNNIKWFIYSSDKVQRIKKEAL
jgi:hypothetical protein